MVSKREIKIKLKELLADGTFVNDSAYESILLEVERFIDAISKNTFLNFRKSEDRKLTSKHVPTAVDEWVIP